MKLIENLVKIRLNEEEFLFINTLNGLMDITDEETANIIEDWADVSNISCTNEKEIELFDKLKSRGYVVENSQVEENIRTVLMNRLLEKSENEKASLKDIALILSYNCNFACPYCYESLDEYGSTKIITEEMVEKAISLSGKELEHITFFGGEPLLLGNKKIIIYITEKYPELSYSVITNGYYLKEYMDVFEKIDLRQVQVTIDGSERTHNLKRYLKNGEGTYSKILDGISCCLSKGIPVKIRMNLNEDNYNECIELREEFIEKFKEYNDILSFEMANIFDFRGKARNLLEKKLLDVDLSNTRLKRKGAINQHLGSSLPIKKFFALDIPVKPIISACRAHTNGRLYDSEGNIYSCILSVGKPELSIGRYFPEFVLKTDTILNRNVNSIQECQKCKYAFLCGGGCPLGINDEDKMKPNCNYCMHELYENIPYIYNNRKNKS